MIDRPWNLTYFFFFFVLVTANGRAVDLDSREDTQNSRAGRRQVLRNNMWQHQVQERQVCIHDLYFLVALISEMKNDTAPRDPFFFSLCRSFTRGYLREA